MVHRREALGAHHSHVSLDTDCLGTDTHAYAGKHTDSNTHTDAHKYTGQHQHSAANADWTPTHVGRARGALLEGGANAVVDDADLPPQRQPASRGSDGFRPAVWRANQSVVGALQSGRHHGRAGVPPHDPGPGDCPDVHGRCRAERVQ